MSMPPNLTSKIWKRDRATGNFSDISVGLPNDTVNWYITYTAPLHYDEAYAIQANGSNIYKTTDAGNTGWYQIPTSGLPSGVVINTMFVNPYNTNEIYVGTRGFGVFKTVLGGGLWSRWENGMPFGMDISGFQMIDSFNTNGHIWLYASSYGRSIWKREISGNDPSAIINLTEPQKATLNATLLIGNSDNLFIRYSCLQEAQLSIGIFDMNGKQIITQVNGHYQAGNYSYNTDVSQLAAGVYVCALFCNNQLADSKRLVITK